MVQNPQHFDPAYDKTLKMDLNTNKLMRGIRQSSRKIIKIYVSNQQEHFPNDKMSAENEAKEKIETTYWSNRIIMLIQNYWLSDPTNFPLIFLPTSIDSSLKHRYITI